MVDEEFWTTWTEEEQIVSDVWVEERQEQAAGVPPRADKGSN